MIHAEYIESGTYVGGEEDAFNAGLKTHDVVIILTKDEHAALVAELAAERAEVLSAREQRDKIARESVDDHMEVLKLRAEVERLGLLAISVRSFFENLDYTEESDSGREFHPLHFGCCRGAMVDNVNRIFADMRQRSGLPPLATKTP